MRTKTLLITAAVAAASSLALKAQVYSVNAVGYINLDLKSGFNLVANQLDNGNGNAIADVLTGVPEGTTVYKFLPDGSFDISSLVFGTWSKDISLDLGAGVWVKVPEDTTVTLVGEVPQGELTNPLTAGFNLVASIVPQAGALQTDLGFPAAEGDTIYQWNGAGYDISTVVFGAWNPAEPTVSVGEGIWAKVNADADWTRNFSVNN